MASEGRGRGPGEGQVLVYVAFVYSLAHSLQSNPSPTLGLFLAEPGCSWVDFQTCGTSVTNSRVGGAVKREEMPQDSR